MKCEKHGGRGRPPLSCPQCATLSGRVPEIPESKSPRRTQIPYDHKEIEVIEEKPYDHKEPAKPREFLDIDGNPPVLDAQGRLLEPFVVQTKYYREKYMPGSSLPGH